MKYSNKNTRHYREGRNLSNKESDKYAYNDLPLSNVQTSRKNISAFHQDANTYGKKKGKLFKNEHDSNQMNEGMLALPNINQTDRMYDELYGPSDVNRLLNNDGIRMA